MTFNRKARPEKPQAATRLLATLCALYLVGVSPAPAVSSGATGEEKRITVEFYPPGSGAEKTNPVTLSFNGRLYEDLPLPESGEASTLGGAAALGAEEKSLVNVIATNRRGSLEEVLRLWNPPERAEVQKMAADPQTFAANQKFYGNFAKTFLKAKIY